MQKFKHLNLEYHSACIIAKANLTDCVEINEEQRKILQEKKRPSILKYY